MQDKFHELKISTVDGRGRGTLSLDKTFLIYHDKSWGGQTRRLIPIELISVSERKRFNGFLLIKSLFLFLLWALMVSFCGVALAHINPGMNSYLPELIWIVICTTFLVVCLFAARYFWQFITDRDTIIFTINENDGENSLEFWCRRKQRATFQAFVEELESRKHLVVDELSDSFHSSIAFNRIHHIRRFLGLVFISLIPAMIFEKAWLLWLGLIPVFFALKSVIAFSSQPKPYRLASKFAEKEQWDKVVQQLSLLDDRQKACFPVVLLMVVMYVRTNRFDQAIEAANLLSEEDREVTQEMQKDIWLMKRIRQRMSRDL